jgi:hypothetical protein
MKTHKIIQLTAFLVCFTTLFAFQFAGDRGWADPQRLEKIGLLVAIICFFAICLCNLVFNRDVAQEWVEVKRRWLNWLPRWTAALDRRGLSNEHTRRDLVIGSSLICVALIPAFARAILNL